MLNQIAVPTITAAGDAGSGAGGTTNTYGVIDGYVVGVHVAFGGTSTTGDIAVTTQHSPAGTVLTLTDYTAGTVWYYPRALINTTAGGTVDYADGKGVHEPIPVCDHVKVTLLQVEPAETLNVTLLVQD